MTARLVPSFTPTSSPLVALRTKPELAVSSLPAPPPVTTLLLPLPARLRLLSPSVERLSEPACRFKLPVRLTTAKPLWLIKPLWMPLRLKLPSRLSVPPEALMVPVLLQVAVPEAAWPRLKVPALTVMVPALASEPVYQVLPLVLALSVPSSTMGSAA